MAEGYAKSGNQWAASYRNWRNVAAQPYVSDTHGARYVNNYANDIGADNYSLFEEAGPPPVGTVLAKDSFVVRPNGNIAAAPLSPPAHARPHCQELQRWLLLTLRC
jgi:hypothetical protein